MPIRFRRTFKILPGVKVNVSKGGISFTVGAKGYHLNFSKRGVKQTVGLPGSGLSQSSYIVKNDPEPESKKTRKADKQKEPENNKAVEEGIGSREEPKHTIAEPRRRTSGWMLLLGIVVIYLGALVLGLVPTNFLSQLLGTLTQWARSIGL